MEAVGDVKEEPLAVGLAAHRDMSAKSRSAEDGNGRPVKRKRVLAELGRVQKRACGSGETNSSAHTSLKSNSFKDAGAVKSTAGKRKRAKAPVEAEAELDSEHVINAAQALYELFGGGSARQTPEEKSRKEAVTWAGKRSRSSRSKKTEDCTCKLSSSSATSATVTEIPEVLDSSASHSHHMEISQAIAETVNREEESETEGRSTGMSPDVGLGIDREHKLVSQSSLESTFPNSRAESPSSPLTVLRRDAALVPKLEEELLAQFGFQRALPMRPVKKPSVLRKPKAEEKSTAESDDFKVVKVAPKQVQQRKPRASKPEGQPLPLKEVSVDLQSAAFTRSVLKEYIEESKYEVRPTELATLNLFEPVKVETGVVKFETRALQKMGSSTQGRLKTALSEAEKEARRLRRVQANRESARQTIRRKQVLCEELARKAAGLQSEKEELTQKMELASRDFRDQLELNQRLKEQMILQTRSREGALAPTRVVDIASPMPTTTPFGGLALPPYWWAFALAQAVAASQSSTPQAGEGSGAPEFNPMLMATIAAFNGGMGMNPNMWMNMLGSSSTMNPLSGNVPAPEQQPTVPNTSARPASFMDSPAMSPQKPAVLVGVADGPHLLGKAYMPFNHGDRRSSLSSMEGVTNPEAFNTVSRLQSRGKAQATGMASISHLGGKTHITGMTSSAIPSSLPQSLPLSGKMQSNQALEGMASTSTSLSLGRTSCQPPSSQVADRTRKPGNPGFYQSFGNGVQGFLGPSRVTGQSGSAALATEARRRRRELKRTKSLQSRQQQGQRLAGTRTL